MAIQISHKETKFAIGDRIRVELKIIEGEKTRSAFFEGMLIAIKGKADLKSITVRRIGEARIGIERIFSLASPNIDNIKIVKKAGRAVRRAKLYYTREKSSKQIERIYH